MADAPKRLWVHPTDDAYFVAMPHKTDGTEYIRADIAPADALAEAQRLREERDELRAAVEGLIAVLDRNDKKGPIPDVEMFFCWLAAQDVRAAFRKIAPKGEAT